MSLKMKSMLIQVDQKKYIKMVADFQVCKSDKRELKRVIDEKDEEIKSLNSKLKSSKALLNIANKSVSVL